MNNSERSKSNGKSAKPAANRQVKRTFKLFRKDHSGVTAIEFGMIAGPFFITLFAIMEIAFIFFGNIVLENAIDNASRLLRTGKVNSQGNRLSEAEFRTEICKNISGLLKCSSNLLLDVQTFSDFSSVKVSSPIVKGQFQKGGFSFNPGKPSAVVITRAFYEWDLINIIPYGVSNLKNGNFLLQATEVFRNEPF